jgi:CO/xanthine dehydrogenase Mo-binding subunit
MMTTVRTDTVHTLHIDAGSNVMGQAIDTKDLPLSLVTLYGAMSLSPSAHAGLVSIDAQQAERLQGVHAVVTREHLGQLNPLPSLASYGTKGQEATPVIALEKVRYEGEPVAAVERQRHYRELSAPVRW